MVNNKQNQMLCIQIDIQIISTCSWKKHAIILCYIYQSK